jgi:hypothetical protein
MLFTGNPPGVRIYHTCALQGKPHSCSDHMHFQLEQPNTQQRLSTE